MKAFNLLVALVSICIALLVSGCEATKLNPTTMSFKISEEKIMHTYNFYNDYLNRLDEELKNPATTNERRVQIAAEIDRINNLLVSSATVVANYLLNGVETITIIMEPNPANATTRP